MSASHGSKASFLLGTKAQPTTLVDVSTFANSVGLTLNRDNAEVSTLHVGSKKYIAGLKDATVPYEGPFDTDIDQQMWDLYDDGTLVSFEYCPAGKGVTGTPSFTGTCFITSYELSSSISDPNAMSGEFQVTGDVARAVQ